MKRRIYWGFAIFIILLASVCFFWYQGITARDQRDAAEIAESMHQWEITRKVKAERSPTETPLIQEPTDSNTPTAEKSTTNTTAITDKTEPTQVHALVQTTENQEVRVSKFGFGPYPELPPDFPYQDLFDPPYYTENPNDEYKDDPDYELMDRLWVELWKQGERVEGIATVDSTGLFYPAIPRTIYVEWRPRWKIAGLEVGRIIHAIQGHADDMKRLHEAETENDIPSNFKILDMSEGIDPYTFLDLPR